MSKLTERLAEVIPEAAARVQEKVSRIQASAERGMILGTGASGDKTLLADKEAEDILLEAVSAVKGMRYVSEEAGEGGAEGGRLLAVIDPLDGSSNFKNGIPFYCTSVAVAEGEGLEELEYALVRDLVTGDSFEAMKGKGASKNGRRTATSGKADLKSAVIALDTSRMPREGVKKVSPLYSEARRVLHFGANALELCFVADGRLDAFVDLRGLLRVTDIAGAYLVVKEAGGTVSVLAEGKSGGAMSLDKRYSIVAASTRELHDEILATVGDWDFKK